MIKKTPAALGDSGIAPTGVPSSVSPSGCHLPPREGFGADFNRPEGTHPFCILNFEFRKKYRSDISFEGGGVFISEIIVAVLGLVGTLTGSLLAGKLTQYRLKVLEDKVDKHNRLIERTYVLEGQMTEVQHEVREIKQRLVRKDG